MVPYETFRRAIKRFGYATDLSFKHLESISEEILCDVQEMKKNEQSPFALTYRSPEFVDIKTGRHSVKKLI